jgi:N-acetylmuramoyl-L-alanine amidase
MRADFNYKSLDDVNLLALCIWREARGETWRTKLAVGCSVRNRVHHPDWWGHDYHSVILDPYQYSSFNASDPNSKKWPNDEDPNWLESLEAASLIINGNTTDTTSGATSYFDKSLDDNPPKWASSAEMSKLRTIGSMHFYKRVKDEEKAA